MQLGQSADFGDPIQVYAPRKGERIDLNDPRESLNQEELYSPRVGFMVKQNKYDSQYVITNIAFTRRLFEREGEVSAVEMKVREGADVQKVKTRLQQMLGEKYVVKDRYEQQEDTFKIMQIEKLISYIFLTFILMIACFNIIGSLSMLIIDKKQDAITLRNLGANEHQISSIFMMEGRMISLLGAVIGIAVGLLLCWLQQEFGIIRFGNSEGSYIINAYPVSVHATDVVLVLVTVIAVGFLSVWYPVRHLSRKYTRQTRN
jgi:lipoprotein-releasing system permease protein